MTADFHAITLRTRSGRIDHVGYMVAELERATRWLVAVLGVTPVGPIVSIPGTEIRVAALTLGDFEWEIVEHPDARQAPYRIADDALGAYRIVLGASKLAGVGAHLSALGVTFEQSERSIRFRDADGFAYDTVVSPPPEQHAGVPRLFDGGVRSLDFNVRSLPASKDWYERSLGLHAVPEPSGESAVRRTGGPALRLSETPAAAGASPRTGMGPAHPAVEVDDVGQTCERLAHEGATMLIPLRRDDHEGSRRFGRSSFFVADPDGLPVQVIGPRT
jgi:catechol 2,3-dioxygenase-like lactoylglutathione lyase family enzyme